MIAGHGIDIVDVRRVRRILERYGQRFLNRCFSEEEAAYSIKKPDPAAHLAARFAAKEAFAKAVGTGLKGFGPKDVYVEKSGSGRPSLGFSERVQRALPGIRCEDFTLSMSHEKQVAVASVIWRSR